MTTTAPLTTARTTALRIAPLSITAIRRTFAAAVLVALALVAYVWTTGTTSLPVQFALFVSATVVVLSGERVHQHQQSGR